MTVHGRFPGRPLAPEVGSTKRPPVEPERIGGVGGASSPAHPAHTPGPWVAVEADEMTPMAAGVMVAVHAAAEHWAATGTICEINGQGDGKYDPAVTNANARLIAAAPRMAGLLLSAYQHVSHGGPKRGDVEDVLREAGLIS